MHVMKIELNGKIGQETVNGKKQGGRVVNISIAQSEADKIIAAVMKANPGKLKALMFDYGMNAKAQEVMAYTPPGSVEWKEGMDASKMPVHEWTEADTEEYLETLRLYGERERTGGFNVEARQKAWDENLAMAKSYGMPEDVFIKMNGKRPVAKVKVETGADEVAAALA